MIQLMATDSYTAVRWTAKTQAIKDLVWLALINKAYGVNPVTGVGYVGYTRGDRYPTLATFVQGVDYLLDVSSDYALDEANAAPDGAFAAFDGYVPPAGSTTPATPSTPTTPTSPTPGFIASAIAAQPIIGGSLVARTAEGIVPHSSKDLSLIHLLFGIALNNALPGDVVNVQRGGYILYPGLGLTPGTMLFVGDNGKLVPSNKGLAFSQIVGRAISPDEFIYQPEAITVLHPFSLQVI
jgi:hypothetical protein